MRPLRSISKAATSGRPSNAIRADAGDGWALAPSFQPGQYIAQNTQWCGRSADGKVIFAVSQEAVSFDSFARLFRDRQKCPNALFLDGGSASRLYAPTLNRSGNVLPLGPMLAVFEINKAAPGQ